MNHTILAAAITAAIATPAAANPLGQMLNFTGQIRAQSTVVRAQTDATFEYVPRGRLIADDIYDELEDLCRDLDRLEEQVVRPLQSRNALRRIERRVEELDEQAGELQEAVHEALDDRRFREHSVGYAPRQEFGYAPRQQFGYAPRQQFGYAIPGVPPHVQRKLPPHAIEHLAAAHQGRASRGSSITFGGRRFQLTIGNPAPQPYLVGRPVRFAEPIGPNPLGVALCAEVDRLRLMTRQLEAIVRR